MKAVFAILLLCAASLAAMVYLRLKGGWRPPKVR